MVSAESRIEIQRPVETVFAFVVDGFFEHYPRWSPQVVEIEPLDGDALDVGRRIRQVRVDHGRRSETIVRVEALERPRHLAVASEHAPWFRIDFLFEPAGAHATEVRFVFELLRLELYMRPFRKLIERAVRQGAEQSVAELRALVEAER